jgi:hypothetical protein
MAKRKWTDEQLIEAVKTSKSYSQVIQKLGLKLCGGTHANIKLNIKKLGLDTEHITGQGWCTGELHEKLIKNFVKIPTEKILVKDSEYTSTHRLKHRLFKEGLLEQKCINCGLGTEWNGKFISLQLDHKDGDRCNNQIDNLRILCPNCHSQTDSFCGKKKKKQRIKIERKNRKTICVNKCVFCNLDYEAKDKNQKYCSYGCHKKSLRKVERPSKEQLINELSKSNYVQVGKKYGVSDNAIRKWLKL